MLLPEQIRYIACTPKARGDTFGGSVTRSATAVQQQQDRIRLVHSRNDEHTFHRRLEHVIEDAPRPYRLYVEQERKWLKYRAYVHKGHAMRGALWMAKWMEIGTTLAIIDVRTGKLHGQYTRRVNHVEFANESLKTLPREPE